MFYANPAFAQVTSTTATDEAKHFQLELGIDLSGGFADNLFATSNYEVDDFVLVTEPTARLTFTDDKNRIVVRGEGEIGRYADITSENYDDWLIGADGRLQASQNLTLLAGGEFQWEHESRSSPDAEDGLEPTQYRRLYLFGGGILKAGKLTFRPAIQLNRYDFDDVAAEGGPINNDDRDRSQYELGARILYPAAEDMDLFVQGAWDRRDYDDQPDDFGFRRDSDGGSVVAGIRKTFSPRLSAEIFAGYLGQDFDDPRLKDVSTFDAGALINWTGPVGLSATFRLDRSIEETTLPGASSYVVTSGVLSISGTPHPRLRAGITLDGTKYDYRGDPRSEFVTSGNAWLRYWLNPHIYAGLDYSIAQRSSNAAGFDYDENRLMLRLGAELRPGYSQDAAAIDFGGTMPAGLYAGLVGGHGTIVTGLDGPRGQGSNTADFGDTGFAGGAMVGYGATVGRIYLGAELEGMLGGPEWLHEADRVFSVQKENSFGLAARIGWLTPANDLIYGRVGISSTSFDTIYTHSENLFDESDRYLGISFGVGVEASAAGRGFVRAEYVLSSYEDINVPTGDDRFDNFSTSEGQFRLGAGIRFGKAADVAKTAKPAKFDGPYVGLQFGHGALTSRNLGVRSGGTPIDIQRAGLGAVGGVFAGVGTTWRRMYVGGEIEADLSAIDWNIERDPNGRIYSTELQYSLGTMARLGWLINNTAMLYGRVGPTWTRFRVPFAASGETALSKETRSGLGIGGGMEMGIGANTRFRIDYSTSDYGGYDVEYGESNSDRFDHRDNMVRLGLALGL